jgi:hypothetical protein
MVAPTPFFNVGVDFGPLIKQIETDIVPLAKTSDVTTAVAPLAKTSDVTTAVAPLAKTTDVTTAVAPLAKTSDVTTAVAPLAKTSDVTTAVAPLAKTTDVTTAVGPITDAIGVRTHERTIFGQLNRLKNLITKHWCVEQVIDHVATGQVRGAFGVLSHRLGLNDSARRASLTVEQLQREAHSLHMGDFLPDDRDDMEELLGTLKAIIENLPSQTHPPSSGSSTRR